MQGGLIAARDQDALIEIDALTDIVTIEGGSAVTAGAGVRYLLGFAGPVLDGSGRRCGHHLASRDASQGFRHIPATA